MKKYPFWVIKRDALRLLKGKWNAIVLALFVPFLCYTIYAVKLFQTMEQITSEIQLEPYLWMQTLVTLLFSVVIELISVGIYRNLQPNRKKANCLNIYLEGAKSFFRLLPTLCIKYLLPAALTALLSSDLVQKFYDYLMFSLMEYTTYRNVVEILVLGIDILRIYLNLSLLLAPCILANHPDYGGFRLMKESFSYARGNRFYLIFLSVSFFGWLLLGSMAFAIGILWAMAYLTAAYYAYYRRLAFDNEPVVILPEE